jgi:hypothetical protein
MGQWVVVCLYLVAASGQWHWSGMGALLLILLFAGSHIRLTYSSNGREHHITIPAHSPVRNPSSSWYELFINHGDRSTLELAPLEQGSTIFL